MKTVNALLLLSLASASDGFAPSYLTSKSITSTSSSSLLSTSTETDDILKPKYEIESIPIRIGHGFDIHRMAPIEEAGQPVVIGGVEITHKDQKVINLFIKKISFCICSISFDIVSNIRLH